ncbi:MAG: hypothetical protein FJ304_18135, partial [Planctomycetes bacterium]|nr:hypothetical protein [Planctomycetota bacterium]
MKRHANLFDAVVAWPNLLRAAKTARHGKTRRPVVERFEFCREWELLALQRELEAGTYAPGPFRTHRITRPKPRLISAAPYRDRVAHHAIMNVLAPVLDARFHPDSYACRAGKGTHAASRRLQQLMGRYPFALRADISQYFPSIDHAILTPISQMTFDFRHGMCAGTLGFPAFLPLSCRNDRGTQWVTAEMTPCVWISTARSSWSSTARP